MCTAKDYRSAREALLVHQSTIGGLAGRAQNYKNNREALLLEQSTIGALGRLCWYSIVL